MAMSVWLSTLWDSWSSSTPCAMVCTTLVCLVWMLLRVWQKERRVVLLGSVSSKVTRSRKLSLYQS